jgi:hypothetical protein|tara:strand:- start:1567 stop:1989 length:423 start_codon:yes stop_codon:yes gene_type:complete
MIKYNLKCQNEHEFESWFSNSEEFEKLNKKSLLECIYCSSKKIKKSIMSPMVSFSKKNDEEIKEISKNLKEHKDQLFKLRKYIENNFDYVGKDFSRKVREIYYDKKSNKAIYGSATFEEREELAEEGINLLSIPWVKKDN